MKMKIFPFICFVIVAMFVMLLFIPNVSAFEEHPPDLPPKIGGGNYQHGPPHSKNQPGYFNDFMAKWDMNRNGVVTKKEYKGSSKTFKMMDRNHNGVIDRSEAASYSHHFMRGFGGGQPNLYNGLFGHRLKNNPYRR